MRIHRGVILLTILAAAMGSLSCDSEGRETTVVAAVVPRLLEIAVQPSGAISGASLPTQPVVEVVDDRLNPVPSAQTEVTVEVASGAGVLEGTRTVAATSGVATFTDLRVVGFGPHTLRFTARGLPPALSSSITISPADVVPSQLAITTQPAGAVSGLPLSTRPVIQVRDTSGNLVTNSSAPVTATLASGTGTLGGTVTVNAVNGIATFGDLRIDGSGVHTISFNAVGLAGSTSASVDVVQSPAALVIQTQPTGATTGSVLATQPVIQIVDNAGLVIANSALTVTAAISTGSGVLLGTRTVAASGGTAAFTDLRVDGQGSHVLNFTTTGAVPPRSSAAFSVAVGPAASLSVARQPAGAVSGAAFSVQPVVHVRDAGSSLVAASSLPVTATVVSGSGTLSGTTTVNAVNGVATFADLAITGSGTHTIQFTGAGVSPAASAAFTVSITPPVATQVAITVQPGGAASGTALVTQPVVQLRDAGNVVVAGASAPVTAAIAGGSGTLAGTTTVNAVNGTATFADLAITGSGTHTLSFSSTGLAPATSSVFIVTGPPTQLAIATQPQGAVSGSAFTTQPSVQVRDVDGNVATTSTALVTAAIASGNGVLSGTVAVAAVNGVATFSNLAITGSGAHTIAFTSPGLATTTSASLNVTGGPATQLAVAMQPSSAQSSVTFSPQPSVQVRDAAGAVVTTSTAAVTASIASGSGTLNGTSTVNAVNGIASFTNLSITGTGAHSLRFSSTGLAAATTSSFDVSALFVGSTKEPANFQLITERDFSSKVESNWLDRGDANFSIQVDSSAPRANKSVGQALFPAGFVAGSGPINTYYNVPGTYKQLYFAMWIKFSPNFEGHQNSAVNKIVFLWIDANANVFLNAQGQGSGPLSPGINLQNNVGGAVRLGPNIVPGATITRGQWHFWEVLLVANTVGQLDGSVRWWLNGVEIGNYTNIGPARNSSNRWEIISWNPTWGGAGGSVSANMYQQIDYIRVSGLP